MLNDVNVKEKHKLLLNETRTATRKPKTKNATISEINKQSNK